MNKSKILQMFAALAAILVIVGSLKKLANVDSMSLTEYAELNASGRPSESPPPNDGADVLTPSPGTTPLSATDAPNTTASPVPDPASALIGASLNGSSQSKARTTYTEGFYYEPLSDNLRRYMLGVSYPAGEFFDTKTKEQNRQQQKTQQSEGQPQQNSQQSEDQPQQNSQQSEDQLQQNSQQSEDQLQPTAQQSAAPAELDTLRYVHIWHYDFSGTPQEGELICNEYIAQDLLEIFFELYRNEYQLEKVLLIDEYDGDAEAAREDNNSFCFYYAPSETDSASSKHASGLAVDINPRYNPRITYEKDGSQTITPASAVDYADRTSSFPYKIDEDDLCCKLFIRHGFTWGGNRNNGKDYRHFQKNL